MSLVTRKSVVCDGCGFELDWSGKTAADARRVARFELWKNHKAKDYCPNCEVPA